MDLEYNKFVKERKNIGISIIDLYTEESLKDKQHQYEDFIKRIIIKFAKRNYKVYLFSFYQAENNGIVVDRILEQVPEEYKNTVKIIKYQNDVKAFIDEYEKMEYMVSTHYYSMILSILFNHKIYNLVQNEKQEKIIKQNKLFRKYIKITDLTFETVMRKREFKKVNKNKVNIIKDILNKELEAINKINNI